MLYVKKKKQHSHSIYYFNRTLTGEDTRGDGSNGPLESQKKKKKIKIIKCFIISNSININGCVNCKFSFKIDWILNLRKTSSHHYFYRTLTNDDTRGR